MKLTFVGTGSGVTSLERNPSSLLLDTDASKTLIDCGDGISAALLKQNIDYNSIDSIIFTHYHPDHFSGISALVTQMKLRERRNELRIFTHKNLISPLKIYLHACYIFEDALDFDLQIIGYDFENEFKVDENFSFKAKQNSHIQNKHEVKSIPEQQFVSASLLVSYEENQLIYTSDIATREDLFLFDIRRPKLFITETTHIDLDWIHGINSYYNPRKIYLTHISDSDEEKIEKYLRNQIFAHKTKVEMAEDGHSVILS